MDPMLILVFFGIIAGLLIGGIAGFLIGSKSGKKKSRDEEIEKPETTAPAPPVPESVVSPPSALTARVREGFQPVVCIWRSRETGVLATEIKGKLYLDPAVLVAEAKSKLDEISREWQTWIGISPAEAVEHIRVDEGSARHTDMRDVAGSPPENASLKPVPRHLEVPGEPLTATLKPRSIVEQIDDILQVMLSESGLANRGIRLLEDPNEGVNVWIGLKRYHSIDEVEDQEALQMIRSAVAEWEKRTGTKRQT